MGADLLIAKRYLWSKRRHPFVGVMTGVSVLGILVGVAALIVVLAVMNGFDEDLKSRIIGVRAHLVIEKEAPFDNYLEVMQNLAKRRDVAGVSPFVEGQALVQKGEWGAGVLVHGIDPRGERNVSKFYDYLVEGVFTDREDTVVVGSELARRAFLKVGAPLHILSQNTKEPLTFKVEGIFSSGMYEYDANLVFLNLANSQRLFEMKGTVSGISLRLEDAEKADAFKRQLAPALGAPYFVRTWMDMNQTLFSALKLEKIVMFLILALIVLVACLNIAGSLTVMVMDKTKDIGILKALGMPPADLMKIFALDGLWIGSLGAFLGLGLGTLVCEILKRYQFVELPKEIYYFNTLPVLMNPLDIVAIVCVAIVLSLLSSFYPALVAARLDPVKALRYE